jgi:adenosylcobyric acid synthase
MEVALHAEAPVLLVGDIDKGGVFAQLYGTLELIAPQERVLVAGMVINKFRGDVEVLKPGLVTLEELTGKPVLGVVPYVRGLQIAEEDSPSGQPTLNSEEVVDVAVVVLPHIANFDDFDPLKREPGVGLRYVRRVQELGRPDLVVLPGTKTTVADLHYLRDSGLADAVAGLAASGTAVLGICGGFQMLGERILDPDYVESRSGDTVGLGLLPVVTTFESSKETRLVNGRALGSQRLFANATGMAVSGYEIHMGSSLSPVPGELQALAPLFELSGHEEGAAGEDGWVVGTYLHGLFHNADLRRQIMANHFRAALDMESIYALL